MEADTLLHVSNRHWHATAAAAIRSVLVIMIPYLAMRRAPRCPAKHHSGEVTGNTTNIESQQYCVYVLSNRIAAAQINSCH
jgi:hypothetical protein